MPQPALNSGATSTAWYIRFSLKNASVPCAVAVPLPGLGVCIPRHIPRRLSFRYLFKTSEFPSFLKNPRFLKSFENDLNDFGIQLFQTEEKKIPNFKSRRI
jgi:hypothetical protein